MLIGAMAGIEQAKQVDGSYGESRKTQVGTCRIKPGNGKNANCLNESSKYVQEKAVLPISNLFIKRCMGDILGW
jgi:hypothetical protein